MRKAAASSASSASATLKGEGGPFWVLFITSKLFMEPLIVPTRGNDQLTGYTTRDPGPRTGGRILVCMVLTLLPFPAWERLKGAGGTEAGGGKTMVGVGGVWCCSLKMQPVTEWMDGRDVGFSWFLVRGEL